MSAPPDFVDRFDEMFRVSYRAAYAVLGDRRDAEDVAQDSLAKALVRWRSVNRHAVPWVARVATNGAIDRWRRRDREPVRDDLDAHDLGAGSVGGPSGAALVRKRADLVRALRTLPRRQREAVVMRHLLDLSEAETASVLRCSVGTVKSATSRGLASLRIELGPAWARED